MEYVLMNKKLWNSQSGLLEYVLQYYDLTTQRNHIFNRNAFSSLILCYLYVSRKPLRKSP